MELPPDVIARMIGTGGGAVLALAVFEEPFTWGGIGKRVACSVVFGMLLSDPFGEDILGWSMIATNRIVAASCITAALGWWVMHAVIRAIQAGWIPGLKGQSR